MVKRICWKKGMRLTDSILRASDDCTKEQISNALLMTSARRFGLLPSALPFDVSVNITKDAVDIVALNCFAITKSGTLIDVHYDTEYTNAFDTRVRIPENSSEKEYLLTIDAHDNQWKDTNDGYEEPVYSFSLIAVNSPLPDNAVPIAHIVDDYGWRVDEIDFVPPCLFVKSHRNYEELFERFTSVLEEIDKKSRAALHGRSRDLIKTFWPMIQQLSIAADKEREVLTPMMLLGYVQRCVSAFTCACDIDDRIELSDAESYREFVAVSCSYKDVFQQIRLGLELCFAISEKIDKLQEGGSVEPSHKAPLALLEAPTIDSSQLVKRCTSSKAKITIVNNEPRATVFYTTNGQEPNESSKSGVTVTIETGFSNSRRREPDKMVVLKAKAFLFGAWSDTSMYEITLQKDIERWSGIEI